MQFNSKGNDEEQLHKDQKPSQSQALILSKARSSSDLREKDSKDTGRFVDEDRKEEVISENEERDSRI